MRWFYLKFVRPFAIKLVAFPIKISRVYIRLMSIIHPFYRNIILDEVYTMDDLTTTVNHLSKKGLDVHMEFYTPNQICAMRADRFSTKEPETLCWIDEYGTQGSTLFDVGANIGQYSIYHSMINNGYSVGFEPSF
jgi:hypothetical protein